MTSRSNKIKKQVTNVEKNPDRTDDISQDSDKDKKLTLFAQYNSLLSKYPLLMNGTQAGIICTLGVIASQYVNSYTSKWIK